jgi:hypothetical protein
VLRYWFGWRRQIATVSVKNAGRFYPFLLVALAMAGYRLEIDRNLFYPSEINPLVRGNKLPVRTTKNLCRNAPSKTIIYDHNIDFQDLGWKKQIRIRYDYYNPHPKDNSLVMPFFMHPYAYYSGTLKKVHELRKRRRDIRIFFAGTYEKDVYSRDFRFPIMNRFQIIETLLRDFSSNILFVGDVARLSELGREQAQKTIVMSITDNTANSLDKFPLSYDEYLRFMSRSYFLIAPPGLCVPWSHTVVDGMMLGTIPILNNSNLGWDPPLQHRKNCIVFNDAEELKARIEEILTSPEENILEMQEQVLAYYESWMKPESFGARIRDSIESRLDLRVDAEVETAKLYWKYIMSPREIESSIPKS